MNLINIGQVLRALRQAKGWSQAQVAVELGLSVPAYSKIETGSTDPNLSRIEQIANVFEVSIFRLLSGEDDIFENYSSELSALRLKLNNREKEIIQLQNKVFELFEELTNDLKTKQR